jgi:uncharacterized protein YcbX
VHVDEIWQYPVKSMVGTTVARAVVDAAGMVGDRTWATRDEVRGGIRGAKKIGELMRCAARYLAGPGGPVEITLPDGATVRSDAPDIDTRLSAGIGHPVTLWPLQPAADLDHYRRGAPDTTDMIEELRATFGREADEPLPDLTVFPPVIFEYESPPGTYLDAFPLMLMTTSALASLQAALPDSVIDVRRFRPSLVLDTGEAPGHPELGWAGRQLHIGEVVLDLVAPCPRCVMVTREVTPGIPADGSVLRHVVRDLGQNVGIYATVAVPGDIRAGAEVTLV